MQKMRNIKDNGMSYIPHTSDDIKEMLSFIGKNSLEELFENIPEDVRIKNGYNIPCGLSEPELIEHMKKLADKNVNTAKNLSFIGGGLYQHFIPVLVDFLSSQASFVTSYTPYQPEVSQGTLQAIFEYQTAISELTKMEISNASLYDGASALAEAILVCYSHFRKKKKKVLLPLNLHPEYREVVETYMKNLDIEIIDIPVSEGLIDIEALKELLSKEVAAAVISSPNFYGLIEDGKSITDLARQSGALVISVVEPVSLGILQPPGDYGADLAVGDGQPLGIPLYFGGPAFGFLGAKKQFLRKLPGRIAGQTVDARGERGFVLTVQTREQHIKRERATSNICTNQALMALRSLIYLTCLGKEGFYEVAYQTTQKAHYLAKKIAELPNYSLKYNSPFFNEFVVECQKPAQEIIEQLQNKGIYGGINLNKWFPERKNELLVAVTECHKKEKLDHFVDALKNI